VVSNFIIQALTNQDITIYGEGLQTRSFCYVDDLVEGAVRMMEMENLIGPVNLGNPDEYTILELAKSIIRLTGSHSKIHYLPLPDDDPVRRCPDITLAREKLDWQPTVKLEEGLTKTIAYFDEVLSSQDALEDLKRWENS
jgi:UDP-glucuronate decarboxylase